MAGATLFLASPEQLLKAIAASCYSFGAVSMPARGDNASSTPINSQNNNDDNTLGATHYEHVK